MNPSLSSRRRFLWQTGGGMAGVALSHLLARDVPDLGHSQRTEPTGGPHHRPKAKRIIQLFMNGGVSQMDTFDYKPELARLHGQKIGPKEKPEGQTGECGAVMKSPFEFRQHGESGRWVSSLFPHQAKWVDEMAFLMAMATKTSVHGPGSYMMNTGFLIPGFPCMGSWISYGLGSMTDNLPTFVVLPDVRGLPYNQKGNFSAAFLPSRHQGTIIHAGSPHPIPDLFPDGKHGFAGKTADAASLALLQEMNREHAGLHPEDTRLDARIASYELAARMQLSAPEAFDLAGESAVTRAAYGLDQPITEDFGRRCLLARRLIERGTRVVQVWSGPQGAVNNWDNHSSIVKELPPIATSVDLPIAGLLGDLKARGLLEDTLVVFTTEFGRTPFEQGSLGRDHNGNSFVTWMAGAGIQKGAAYGRSDDLGFKAVEGITYCYDLHATILHLMGIDHTRLTFRTSGVDRRLTDVHGRVVSEVLG